MPTSETVFLLDVDNTLLDNDRVTDDLRRHLLGAVGPDASVRFWQIFETLRSELGYADYLGALQRWRIELETAQGAGMPLLAVSNFLIDYPFAKRLFPRSLDLVAELSTLGPTVILSDGDVVFQPRKVRRSGLWDAVEGRVLIYIHKEQMLAQMQREYPARRYVMFDDKLRILTAMKRVLGERLITVFPRQGHYARDAQECAKYPPADVAVERIGDVLDLAAPPWLAPASPPA